VNEPPTGPDHQRPLRVGDVATATGLSVRALHHYESIGLLRPSGRTPAGHRFYRHRDIERLQRIAALRQLGFALEQIKELDDGEPLAALLRRNLARLERQIDDSVRLRDLLRALAARLEADESVPTSDLLQTIKEMTMFERHFTKEQLDHLAARRTAIGEERIREVERQWPRLIAAVRAHMRAGDDPQGPAMRELAKQWQALVLEFTGGDAGIARGVADVFRHEPAARQRTGLDAEVMDYVRRALTR